MLHENKLNVESLNRIQEVKAVPRKTAEAVYDLAGFTPEVRLRSMCEDCVFTKVKESVFLKRVKLDIQKFNEASKPDEDENPVWIGKETIKNFKNAVHKRFLDKSNDDNPVNGNNGCEDSAVMMMDTLNYDIACNHPQKDGKKYGLTTDSRLDIQCIYSTNRL